MKNETGKTQSFNTRWTLKNWVLILAVQMTKEEMEAAAAGLDNVKNGKSVVHEFNTPCWIHGQLFNRPGFTDNTGVLTSRIQRVEMIDNTIYAITSSGSCYRLEDGIDGLGIRDSGDDVTVECVKDGKTCRYKL